MITKEFILQCEKAREIQKNWKPKRLDIYVYAFSGIVASEHRGTFVEDGGEDRTGRIWLPNQAQLQGMILESYNNKVRPMVLEFENFIYNHNRPLTYKNNESMEELWLAFVMKELYSKQWSTDKKEWVVING